MLSGSGSQRGFIAAKAPSNWRKGEASHNPPAHRMDLLPVQSNNLAALKPRSSSLNPLIYPTWWGDDADEFDKAIIRKERSYVNVQNACKRVLPDLPRPPKHKEDSLERRMREAR